MTESFYRDIKENYMAITEAISTAAARAAVPPESITFLGATKTVDPAAVNYAISLGLKAIGENRVQELVSKYPKLSLGDCDCQFIGQLQTNKIRQLLGKVSQIQSIDSLQQINELSRLLAKNSGEMKVLIEVNVGEESGKGGVYRNALYEFIDAAREYSGIHINGLMAIPPICDNNSKLRDYFLRMRQSFVDIRAKKMDNVSMNILSMGMSCDFTEAILCGANMVRVGSSLFGKRNY